MNNKSRCAQIRIIILKTNIDTFRYKHSLLFFNLQRENEQKDEQIKFCPK